MRDMTAAQLARLLGTPPPTRPLDPVRGASHHSDRIRPGDAFFALPGEREHGIAYAEDALARGASLVVSDREHPRGLRVPDPGDALLRFGGFARARLRVPVIGVTGSAGKTTAKALIAAAVDGRAGPGNLNTPWALAGLLVRAWADDDGAPTVLELGIDRPGEMAELLALVRPDLGLVTAISESHLDALGDLSTVAREKARLLEHAPRGLAAGDAWRQLPTSWRERIVRYGLHPHDGTGDDELDVDAHAWTGALEGDALQPVLHVRSPSGEARAPLPGPGRGLAESAVGALAVADALGLPLAAAAERLLRAPLEPGRLRPQRYGSLLVLDDSYNSNPASARLALELLREAPAPRAAVLGDMLELGAASPELHRSLVAATVGLDRVLLVGDAIRAAREANPDAEALDHHAAEARLRAWPRHGTVLVKASRGLRFERLVDALAAPAVTR